MSSRAILTDIEGTTTSVSFVYQVLFPYAAKHLRDFILNRQDEADVRLELEAVRAIIGQPDADTAAIITQLTHWIDTDQKITPLKTLQGMIWKQGYAAGDFKGHVYPDAFEQLRRWHAQGIPLYVYSSGSVDAQKLLFGHSDFGDMTPLFSGYFDTRSGGKRDSASYTRIADSIGLPASDILFLSDIPEEIDAARAAGMQTAWLVREQTRLPAGAHANFTDIQP
jgi:enolase-phosphatase E1